MKLISKSHIDTLQKQPDALWNGGPPPADGVWGWVTPFVVDIGRFMSLSDAMHKHNVPAETWQTLIATSPWVCEQINALVAMKTFDAELLVLAGGTGKVKLDEGGAPLVDEQGRLQREKPSEKLLQLIVERNRQSSSALPLVDQQPDFPDVPPLLPSNADHQRQLQIDDCHMALNALRPAVRAGDRQAIDTFIKTQDRLAKLQGTDAPKQSVTYLNTDGTANLARLNDAELDSIARQGLTLVQGADGTYSAGGDE